MTERFLNKSPIMTARFPDVLIQTFRNPWVKCSLCHGETIQNHDFQVFISLKNCRAIKYNH